MLGRSVARVAALLLGAMAWRLAMAEANFQDAGTVGREHFEVDVSSIRTEAGLVRFRVRSQYQSDGVNYSYAGHIGVDCAKRLRAEFYNSRSGYFEVGENGPPLRTVFDGTRQAQELDMVCKLASQAPKSNEVTPVALPPEPGPAVVGPRRLTQTATGLVVSPDGWVVAPAEQLQGCSSVDVVVAGQARPALVGDGKAGGDYVVLKIDGGPYIHLRPRGDALPKGSALTLLGYAADATLHAQPRVSTAYVSGGEAGEREAGQPWITVSAATTMAVGAVLDDQGQFVGLLRRQPSGKSGQIHGSVTRAASVRQTLEYHGIDWSPQPAGAPRAVGELLRRAVPATVLVACYAAS